MAPIRLALAGNAHGHLGIYCSVWKPMPDVALTASWDHDSRRAEAFAGQWGTQRCDDLDALLARNDVDGVIVGVETAMHADVVVPALEAGKPVVLQKPLCLTIEDADAIVDAVERTGTPFTLAWQMRVDPQNLQMQQLMRDGTIGRVLMFRRRHGLPCHRMGDFGSSWHTDPELNRGMWADDAAHPIDLVYFLFGMPRSVTAEIDTLYSPDIPDDHGIAIFRYPDGKFVEVVSSFICEAAENTTEIIGTNGSIIQNYGDVPSCNVPRPPDAVGLKWFTGGQWHLSDIASPGNHAERIQAVAGPIAQFLRGQRPPIATAREGRDVLRLVLASHESAHSGRRIPLGETSGRESPGQAEHRD